MFEVLPEETGCQSCCPRIFVRAFPRWICKVSRRRGFVEGYFVFLFFVFPCWFFVRRCWGQHLALGLRAAKMGGRA